jgi:hypothetical protein
MIRAISMVSQKAMAAMGLALVLSSLAGVALAGGPGAPEIDPSSLGSAATLLAGGWLVLASRKRKA